MKLAILFLLKIVALTAICPQQTTTPVITTTPRLCAPGSYYNSQNGGCSYDDTCEMIHGPCPNPYCDCSTTTGPEITTVIPITVIPDISSTPRLCSSGSYYDSGIQGCIYPDTCEDIFGPCPNPFCDCITTTAPATATIPPVTSTTM